MEARFLVSLIVLSVLGCGEDHRPIDDGGTVDSPVDVATPAPIIDPPTSPAPPSFAPCPTGWREVELERVIICDPYPEGGASDCGPTAAHFPGTPGCAEIGRACGASEFPDPPAGGSAWYVRAGSTSGDGSSTAPFGTLTAALSVAAEGDSVLLAAGTYTENVRVPAGVRLEGACTAGVILTSDDDSWDIGVVTVDSPNVEISHLSIADTAQPGILISAGGSAHISAVSLRDTSGAALLTLGGDIVVDEVVVDGVRTGSVGTFGRALIVEGGGTAEVRRMDARQTGDIGVAIASASTLTLEESAIRDSAGGDEFGRGLQVSNDASATLYGVIFEEVVGHGIIAARADPSSAGPTLDLEHVVIRDVAPRIDGNKGRGIEAQLFTRLHASRLLVQRTHDVGVLLTGDQAAELEDVMVLDTASEIATGEDGSPMVAQIGGLVLRRAVLARGGDIGLLGIQADVEIEDVVIVDMRGEESTRERGRGVSIQDRSTLSARRVSVRDVKDVGIYLHDTEASLEDVRVEGVVSNGATRRSGRGFSIGGGSTVALERIEVSDVRDFGVFAQDEGVSVTGSHIQIGPVLPRACVAEGCAGQANGVLASTGASVDIDTFEITEAALCGVLVVGRADLDIADGVVRNSGIGACIQSEGYDVGRLQRGVQYRDNGANLDTIDLPVPEADAPTELDLS